MEKKRFLFLGNSHTYFHDMPELFRRMCVEGGCCQAEVSMLAQPCVTYEWHRTRETELRYALLYGRFDVLIMQQAAHSPQPAKEETIRDGREIIRQARRCGVQPVQILPWAEKRLPEHQTEINGIYRELAAATGVPLVPVGEIFERARGSKEIPDLYWEDGEHASPWGAYAEAAAIYALLSGRSPVGLRPKSLCFTKVKEEQEQKDWAPEEYPLEPKGCLALQELVWDTVRRQQSVAVFR